MNSLRFIFLALLASFSHTANAVILVTEEYPPFNIVNHKNGEISGLSTDKVIEIMHRAGEKYTLAAYPWTRAVQMALNSTETCVYSTSRTPARENLYKWVGPLSKQNWVIFARADDTRNPKSLDDLRPYVIGAYRSDAIAEFLSVHGFVTDLASTDADNPRKMLHGRFDFWAAGELLGWEIIKQQGLNKLIVQLFTFNQTDLYLACNKNFPQAKIDSFNQLLKEMEKDGSSAAIEKKYK